jgi:hypothetical protein
VEEDWIRPARTIRGMVRSGWGRSGLVLPERHGIR